MIPKMVPLLMLAVALNNCVFSQAQSGCKEECGDYHRICPALTDPNFYEDYKTKYEAGQLGDFSKDKAPLPPTPNCDDSFYQLGCPHSCKLCTPCKVDASALTALEAKLTAQIQELAKRSINCNPCTEIIGTIANGEVACLPKYEVGWIKRGDCSCNCGPGVQTLAKQCLAYAEVDSQCKPVNTDPQNCPTDGPETKTEACSPNGPCTVTAIAEKTANSGYSDSRNTMTYKGYTASGQVCDLGVVRKNGNNQRRRNTRDDYTQSEIENPICDEICLKADEKFDYITITIDGEDGWKTDWIQVTVNGGQQNYVNKAWLDDRETLKYV